MTSYMTAAFSYRSFYLLPSETFIISHINFFPHLKYMSTRFKNEVLVQNFRPNMCSAEDLPSGVTEQGIILNAIRNIRIADKVQSSNLLSFTHP